MEFPPLDRRTNLISLEFATVQRNSLLLYNPGGSSSREFFALEILNGVVHLSYDLGSGPVRLQTHKQVADGHFHRVTVRRIGNVSFRCTYIRLMRWHFKLEMSKSDTAPCYLSNRWVLYMWTTAQMLRTMDFVFHRVMAAA